MKICIIDSLKRRNNAVSNLVVGLRNGFQSIDQDFYTIKYDSEKVVDPSKITLDTDAVLIPYWIGSEAFMVNIFDIKRIHPHVKIGLLTGTSPFWHGCSWVDYHPAKRSLTPNMGKFNDNFKAIDFFFVVTPRPGVNPANQFDVGMGILSELRCGPKMKDPTIVLDFLKKDWDEPSYQDAVNCLNLISRDIPNLTIIILGSNEYVREINQKTKCFSIPHELNQFEQMTELWSKSWAFICHNESFGYCLIENFISGTPVFTSPRSEIPRIHTQSEVRVKPLSELKDHLIDWSEKNTTQRQQAASMIRTDYVGSHPQFCSWDNMCRKIVFQFEKE